MADRGRHVADIEGFFRAVSAGDREEVERLLDRRPELVEARDAEGRTGLLLAVYHGQHELVNLLTERRPVMDVFEAAASGQAGRVLELIREEPRRAGYTSPDGYSPLGLASFFGYPAVVDILLKAGADPNLRSRNAMQVMPLHSAAANRDPGPAFEIARLLLDAGADPSATQRGGWTPLHQAAAHGNLRLVQLLLDRGADRDASSDDGHRPVDMARDAGARDVADLLDSPTPTSRTDRP